MKRHTKKLVTILTVISLAVMTGCGSDAEDTSGGSTGQGVEITLDGTYGIVTAVSDDGITVTLGELVSASEMQGQRPGGGGADGEMPEGEMPDLENGEMPEMPEGEMPDFENGEMPEMPEGEMPDFENGEMPEMPDREAPEMPGGTASDGDADFERSDMQQPGDMYIFEEGTKEANFSVTAETKISAMEMSGDTEEKTLSDIEEGDIVEIVAEAEGKANEIIIRNDVMSKGGEIPGNGGGNAPGGTGMGSTTENSGTGVTNTDGEAVN